VVGWLQYDNYFSPTIGGATLWQNGQLTDLGAIGGSGATGYANAINNVGQIVGGSELTPHDPEDPWSSPINHATLWQNGQIIDIGAAMPGASVPGDFNQAMDINDKGQVLIQDYSTNQTALWQNGQITQYGVPTGSINNSGQIVGGSSFWANGQTYSLSSLLAPSSSTFPVGLIRDINDLGQIVGVSQYRAFLATPTGTLNWTSPGNGAWDDGSKWELGFIPNKFLDTVIAPTSGSITVTGPDTDSTIKSLVLGGGGGAATLNLNGGDLTVNETVKVKSGGFLDIAEETKLIADAFIQSDGHTTVDGTLEADTIDFLKGTLDGTGTLIGTVTIGEEAVVNPGHSPGRLNIVGDFILDGVLNIQVAGLSIFDYLDITGDADFSQGIINFSFIDGFMPTVDDKFDWLNVGGQVTGFNPSNIYFSGLQGGQILDINNFLSPELIQGTPSPIPEPASIFLLGIGITCLVGKMIWNKKRL
jgi:probable HAF family extracellular repeat protein